MGRLDRIDLKGKQDINFSGTGTNLIISPGGSGTHLEIDFLTVIVNPASTIRFVDGALRYGGDLPLDTKGSITFENASGFHPPFILGNNSTFSIFQTETSQCSGWAMYRIVGS